MVRNEKGEAEEAGRVWTLCGCRRYDGLEEISAPRSVTVSRCSRHEGRFPGGILETAVPAKQTQVHAGVRLRGRRDIRAPSAVLLQGAEPGHRRQADRRLGAGPPSRGRRQANRQMESSVSLETHTRHQRADGVVARHAGSGHREVPSQRQWEVRVFRFEEGD